MDLGAGVGLEWKPLIDLIPSPAKRSPFDIIFIKSIFEQLLNFSRCAISKASKNGIFDLFLSICLRRRNCCQMCALIVFWECSEDQFGPTKKRSTIFFSKIHRPLPIRENPRSAPADIEATRGGSRIFQAKNSVFRHLSLRKISGGPKWIFQNSTKGDLLGRQGVKSLRGRSVRPLPLNLPLETTLNNFMIL